MCDRYSCIFYRIPIKSPLKTSLKLKNTIFLTLVFSKQNGVRVKLSNSITSSQRHNARNVFATKNVDVMISPGCIAFRVFSDKQIGAHCKGNKNKTHVQTARESHDLNMDFRLFDNGFKQLCVTNFMQECRIRVKYARITITHVCFIALTLAGSLGRSLNTRPAGLVFKQLSRDPANVNA